MVSFEILWQGMIGVGLFMEQVIVGASERCLDPIPLEPPILDKLIQAKLAKKIEQNPISL